MARPIKVGLKYFPFDVDFFNDEKIEAISGEFGIKGEIVAIKLLCAVYRNGYFIEWSEMLQMKMLKQLPSISKDLLDQILSRLIRWDFFDENLFNSAKILTSKGIQKRYFEAMKRNSLSDSLPFLLVSVTKTRVNVTETPINVAKTTQKKEKENKVNVLLEKEPKYIHIGEDENFSENSEELKISEEKKEKISPQPPKKRKSQGDRQLDEKSQQPEISEFLAYAEEIIVKNNLGDFSLLKFPLEAKYNAWNEAGWKDGNGSPIKNWKTKLQNVLPYLRPISNLKNNGQTTYTTGNRQSPRERSMCGTGNSSAQGFAGNSSQTSGTKVSAHTILARKYAQQFAQNNATASEVVDVEAHEL